MKILTLNINSIRAHIESLIKIMESGEYDTLLIQELKVETESFPHIMFDSLGYNVKVFGQKSWNGVAVFSKLSIEDVTRGIPDYPDQNARMIECVIDGKIRLVNVYMPNGESEQSPKFTYKLEWMNNFSRYISNFLNSEEQVIIGGDFNIAIEDRDVWDVAQYKGSSISAPAAREIMQKWLALGWKDCFRRFNPDAENPWTWIGYRGAELQKDRGLRLDYFLANTNAQKIIKNCYIDRRPRMAERPTDHCGLVLEI